MVAAPPMSFFMLSMPLSGLMSSPPVSKHTPLPTSVILGCDGSPQVMSIRRGARSAARPTAWMSGKFSLSRSSPTIALMLAPWRAASDRAAYSSSAGPMSFAGVLIRSRASQTPSTMRVTSSPSTPAGSSSRTLSVVGLAIAREAIGAEREGERLRAWRQSAHWRSDRCPTAAVRAGRPGRKRSDGASSSAKQDAGEAAVRPRQQQMLPGARLEAGGLGKGRGVRIQIRRAIAARSAR